MAEDIHDELDALGIVQWRVVAIVHAMIDAGAVARLECQLPECVYPHDRSFTKGSGRGHNRKGLVVDHIIPMLQGGNSRPGNLRILHAQCNVKRSIGWKQTPEVRAKMSEARRRMWAEGRYANALAKRRPGWNAGTKRHGGKGGRGMSDEHVREARVRFAEGESYSNLARHFGVSLSTVRRAVDGIGTYGDVT